MTKFETSYERALAAVRARKEAGQKAPARFARPSLPHKYPRIHYEIPEMKEVYDLVNRHGLFLIAESLAAVGFHNAQIAKRARDRDYGEDLFRISKMLMTAIADNHVAANQITGTSTAFPSATRMSEIADAIGFHMVIEAITVPVGMAGANALIGGKDARGFSALNKALIRVANEAKVLTYAR